MDSQFFRTVEQSATVLTASKRLSRSLVEGYNDYQRDKGRPVWKTPRILPLDGWLTQCWLDWLLSGNSEAPVLLNQFQEAALWESIILESPAGRSLLRIPETAEQAMKAWALLHAYRLPFERGAFSVSDDCEAFFGWAREFEQRRDANGWIESARLPDAIAALIKSGRMQRPFPVIFAGFDELTPQQQNLLDALCGSLNTPADLPFRPLPAAGFLDTNDEIAHAASWARQRLQSDHAANIGVVVPDIHAIRSKLESAFAEAIPGAFHFSLGPALRDYPIVHAALLLLGLASGPVEIEPLGMILRSPYWKGGDDERSRRALLDVSLRKQGRSPLSLEAARLQANHCPILNRAFGALDKDIRRLAPEQSPSQWSRTFARLLKQIGWPGDRPLSSEEFQTLDAWNKRLSTFASLDAVTPRLTFDAALARFEGLARMPFEPENEGAPVQITGLLEASGLRFDHLWVVGLHDEAVPPPAQPNPFLPLGLQRERGLPHSSAQRELEFNRKLLARLLASAPEVVCSYPRWEGDQARGPSPLIQVDPLNVSEPLAPRWFRLIHATAPPLESVEDRLAPPLPVGFEQRGGTHVLKDMASCPFRAFAQNRLAARELEGADLGLNARDKGSGVHKVLELIWAELKTQDHLRSLDPQQLEDLIAAKVDQALIELETGRLGLRLERSRLQRLLTDWFEIEKHRPPFRVLQHEQERTVTIGGLQISTRIDRVDELPDGRRVIIDYKTGKVSADVWSGQRLDEPQVPLYCVSAEARIAGAAFAQIRSGDLQLKGIASNGELGKLKPMDLPKDASVAALIKDWDQALHKLGNAFRAGVADVDPKEKSTCDYCPLPALCRIHDHA